MVESAMGVRAGHVPRRRAQVSMRAGEIADCRSDAWGSTWARRPTAPAMEQGQVRNCKIVESEVA